MCGNWPKTPLPTFKRAEYVPSRVSFRVRAGQASVVGFERIGMVRFTAKTAAALAAAVAMLAGIQSIAGTDDNQKMIAVGAKAPPVVGKSTNAGTIEDFDMGKSLSQGAVVLYFFPKAFTAG